MLQIILLYAVACLQPRKNGSKQAIYNGFYLVNTKCVRKLDQSVPNADGALLGVDGRGCGRCEEIRVLILTLSSEEVW
jgi:hypothetical protein